MTTLPNGAQVGRYRIREVLGTGGFGITYRAESDQDDVDYAIKELFPSGIVMRARNGSLQISKPKQFQAEKAAFLAEARALERFKRHPNIVKVIETVEKNNTAYIVMQLVDGWDLSRRVGSKSMGFTNPFRLSEWQPIMLPLLDALEELHTADPIMLHRDISPANLRLTHGGKTAVLLDFGAARELSANLSRSLTAILAVGFAPYEQYTMSDEELENEGVTSQDLGALPAQGPWTDIYGLAAVSYYALTARRPPASILRKSGLGTSFVPLAERLRDDPERDAYKRLIASIDKALSVEPKDRFQSADEWRKAILPKETPPPPPPPPPPPLEHWKMYCLAALAIIVIYALGRAVTGHLFGGGAKAPNAASAPPPDNAAAGNSASVASTVKPTTAQPPGPPQSGKQGATPHPKTSKPAPKPASKPTTAPKPSPRLTPPDTETRGGSRRNCGFLNCQ